MDEKEFNNIVYTNRMLKELLEAVRTSDVEKFKEMKGQLKTMESVMTPLEMSMGLIIAALVTYQDRTKRFDMDEEQQETE